MDYKQAGKILKKSYESSFNWHKKHGMNKEEEEYFEALSLALKAMEEVEKLPNTLKKYFACDNLNCGKGAICNYCALKSDMDAIAQRIKKGE